ncbi:MAG: tetratricopeptide repeat protein [Acidobacteriaceae bacterium]|jgi:tetratricopeptide (TPR) repeat protein/mono/diheme cytochrome c family protein|nr:tetratricopeptide repeat protein [Acidobacteriaceae bacterium]
MISASGIARLTLLLCAVLCAPLTAFGQASGEPVTYSKQIAPIVFQKCGSCHHPNGVAPFSLVSYGTARTQASQMAAVTARGFMPPWKADPAFGGPFVGQPTLTAEEKDLIARWAASGAPEGDRRDLPPLPKWSEGWQLGTPDLVVRPPRYTLPADGTDVFRIFVIPLPVNAVRYVRAVEFQPGNARVVHHANIRIDRTRTSRRFDDADPAPGYEGLIAHSATYPDGHFLGWTPGQVAPLLPKGLAWRLEPDTDLVVELHMQPSGKEETVQPTIGLYFGADPPERTPVMLRLGRQSIDIPPGEAHYSISDSYVLPVDVEVQAVQPHAHQRAREVTAIATLPDGSIRPLIHIADWDFRWQHVFRYQRPFTLPRGTRLSMTYVYDNSADNPRNPVIPPVRVYWGQRSGDEMGDVWIQVLTKTDADLVTLSDAFNQKVMAEDVIGYERWIQSDPKSSALHDDVGTLYLKLNRPADAVRHFAISAGMTPTAAAHFNLGTALTLAGQSAAAIREYERALELRPEYPQAHTNLGSLLLQSGHLDEAMQHLQEALRLDPENAQANFSAGVGAAQQNHTDAAVTYFRRALKAQPEFPDAMVNLAWTLATASTVSRANAAEAVTLAERVVTVTGRQNPAALDVLGAAYAAAGDFGHAEQAAGEALALNPSNAAEIGARRELYRAKKSYRLP